MRSHSILAAVFLLGLALPLRAESDKQNAADSVSFEEDVRPILKAHCLECHGEGEETGGELDLRLSRFIHVGGDSGPGVVAGSPDESPLVERTASQDMPPGEVKLTEEDVDVLRRWVATGAKTLRPEPESIPDGVYVPPEEREFWSFRPIQNPEVPEVAALDRVRNPIDAFLLRRLEEEQMAFSPDADRQTFIRRATFDLTGLPPTRPEVEEFIADTDPQAVENLIDRLLESPAYGERWGRHWLDVVGYADSEGYTVDDPVRSHAYHYRDYVISAFNDDMPFDRFIREQLAGDEMIGYPKKNLSSEETAKLIATGFLRMVPDGTGKVSGEEKPLAQNQVMADALHVVGSSLLGLTLSCAQCHNHRYDPIPHAEYFQVRAIFEPAYDWKNWRNPGARLVSLYTDDDRKTAAEIEAEAKVVDAEYKKRAAELIAETLEDQLVHHVPEELHDAVRLAYQTPVKKRTEEQNAHLKKYPKILKISTGSLYLYDRELRGKLAGLKKAYAEKTETVVAATQEKALAEVAEEVAKPFAAALLVAADKRTKEQKDLIAAHPDLVVTAGNLAKHDKAAAAELAALKAEIDQTKERAPQLAAIRSRASAIRAKKPKEEFVRALTEIPAKVPETFLFSRGDHRNPRQEVKPAVLSIPAAGKAVEIPVDDENLPTTGRRLAYAKYLTSGEHPLVARVLVNRFWMHHFGKGIVTTPSDFGILGDRPSHPELLDWLATYFMTNEWSVKELHKLIMTSTAYRQALRTMPADGTDPDNRLLSGMSLRRLEAETLRDSVLAVSGKLNAKRFGPPVPVMADRVGQIVVGKENLSAGRPGAVIDMKGEDSRRSVYVQVRRSRPLGLLDTFDAPKMAPNCETRATSTVAPQSLLLMNSEFLLKRSSDFAGRLAEEAGEDRRAQVKLGWELALCQTPSEEQVDMAVAFIDQQEKHLSDSAEAAALAKADKTQTPQRLAVASFCQTLLGSNRFLYVD
ncbi:Planctomycete cytochrome C [Roseimaritima multifibrata]|uniref:Planctomycete cytochrome C n=1 Tax=Roseimaritima multifibrata TaxID=1930274 RepID=A0A517MHK7_9BACT|nr:PSD1 and planctomycete cytochrome C domain-containing protein [Roseimaritima multifibrata]QDS94370.1 Planctomycete cytochrome C [Roseimaritima multifibrata]